MLETWWDWLSAINWQPSWVAAAAALAGAGAAWWAAWNGSRTLARARGDSRDKSRPMLAAELRSPPYTTATQVLVITNFGPTIARNVSVSFDPPIPDPSPGTAHESVTPFLKKRYAKPIPVLVPGVELDNVYFIGKEGPGGQWLNSEPGPDQVTVHLSYEGPDGTTYHDDFPLDVALIRQRTYTTSSTQPSEQAKKALKALQGIEASLAKLTLSLSRQAPPPSTASTDEDPESLRGRFRDPAG